MQDRLALAYIVSDKDSHFTTNLTTGNMEIESLLMEADWTAIQINECIIESVSLQSDQNLAWDVILFAKASTDDTNLDLDEFVDLFRFSKVDGIQVAAANQFYYPSLSNHMSIAYKDNDLTGKIHVGLVNRSVTAKNTGATGEVKIRITVRPIFGG